MARIMNIKRMIAREGLIVIAICLLLSLTLYLNSREQAKKYVYETKAKIVEVVESVPATGWEGEAPKELKPTGLYVMAEKPTDLILMVIALKKDFPTLNNPSFIAWDHQSNSVTVLHHYDNAGKHRTFIDYSPMLIALVFSYSAYLLIRFILWAVKVLRQ